MKKIKLKDGTEIEISEENLEAFLEENQKELKEKVEGLEKELNEKKEEAEKKEAKKKEEASKEKETDKKKGVETDPFIEVLKAERKASQEKAIQDASKGNADLEKAIMHEMKAFENSTLSFDEILQKSTTLAVSSNPEKNFSDVLSGGNGGTSSFHDGGETKKGEVSSDVLKMFKQATGSSDEEVTKLMEQRNG